MPSAASRGASVKGGGEYKHKGSVEKRVKRVSHFMNLVRLGRK